MNHAPVSSKTRSFIVDYVGVTMMTEWRIWDQDVTVGGVNNLVP
jgi:hypothetical protein